MGTRVLRNRDFERHEKVITGVRTLNNNFEKKTLHERSGEGVCADGA